VVANARQFDHRLANIVSGNTIRTQAPKVTCMARTDGQYVLAGQTVDRAFGARWASGHAQRSAFNTVIAPNGPNCVEALLSAGGNSDDTGFLPPSSMHPGGVVGAMCDGSVRFISETIDTGNLAHVDTSPNPNQCKHPSHYGVWGAMGSKDALEAANIE
jgi:hypothetical protein